MNVAYITKDSTKEEIYEAYIKTQKLLKAQRHLNKKNADKVSEVRKQKNGKIRELGYKLFKAYQLNYGLNKHLQNVQRFAANAKYKYKKLGIEEGKGKIRTKDYAIIKMYSFLLQIEKVSEILEMPLDKCAFFLWAGRYSFFTRDDFKKDFEGENYSFTNFIGYGKKNNFIISVSSDKTIKRYALTALGLDIFNKVDRFTKKHFKVDV